LLLVELNAAYLVTIKFDANDTRSTNDVRVQPVVTIVVELDRDGTTIDAYTNNYQEFKHPILTEAYNRAYRSIENDLDENFVGKVRGLRK
jgi:hypothetical protein